MTPHQLQALNGYFSLEERYEEELFTGRSRRPIVLNRARCERFAERTGTVLGLVAENDFIYYVVDLIETDSPDDDYPYLRIISKRQLEGGENVVVIAAIANSSLGPDGGIVLVEQERHSTGKLHLELPRGFAEPGLSGQQNALDELQKETGFLGDVANLNLIGRTFTDSGLTDARVSFYHVSVSGRTIPKPEMREAIRKVVILPKEDILKKIGDGEIEDSFTVQAVALLNLACQPVTK